MKTPLIRTDWLERHALYHPEAPALEWVPTGTRWTYDALNRLGNQVARFLRDELGLQAGDRVGILGENTAKHVHLFVATQKAGVVLLPLNFRLTVPELQFMIEDAQPAVLFYTPSQTEKVEALRTPAHRLPLRTLADARALSEAPTGYRARQEDPIMILYTSGTTGKPKGAIITHGMLFWNSVNTALRLNLTASDVSFNVAPFYHTGGWNVLLTPFLHHGAFTLLLDRFDPAALLRLCDARGITILWGVPTMLKMMADDPAFQDVHLKTVRYAVVGGEAMPEPLIRLWQEKGVPIRQGFGMTEVGPNCFSLPERDAIRKIGSIGFPNFYIDVRLVDEEGKDVPVGRPGELLMRGPVVTPGYWRNPEATRKAMDAEGWFHTGDLLRVDEEGYYYVVGRKKDMYISGGENVYPAEVEAVFYEHPAVVQVAVVGVPDPKWGETGMAFVVLKPGMQADETELRAFVETRLARYKQPRYIVFKETLPTGHSGKILKQALRKEAFQRITP